MPTRCMYCPRVSGISTKSSTSAKLRLLGSSFHFNRPHLEQIMDKEQKIKYVDVDYGPDSDDEILATYEN